MSSSTADAARVRWFESSGRTDRVLFRVDPRDPSGPEHATFTAEP